METTLSLGRSLNEMLLKRLRTCVIVLDALFVLLDDVHQPNNEVVGITHLRESLDEEIFEVVEVVPLCSI